MVYFTFKLFPTDAITVATKPPQLQYNDVAMLPLGQFHCTCDVAPPLCNAVAIVAVLLSLLLSSMVY